MECGPSAFFTLIRHASRATFPREGEGSNTGTYMTAQ